MRAGDLPGWVRGYLEFLGLSPEPPSLDFLGRLLRAHLHRIPFENISKLWYFRRLAELGWSVPPPEIWTESVRRRNFGGTCFTINSNLYRALLELGYDARLMRVAGGGHLSVGVRLEGRLHLVDPGLGAPLFAPVDLSRDTSVDWCGRGMRIYPMRNEPGAYHMDHYSDGKRKLAWTFSTLPEPLSQFGPNIDNSYSPTGYFMVYMTCSLYSANPDRNLSLANSAFTVRHADGRKIVTVLDSVEDIETVLREEFRLPGLPVREAIETLAGLGVDVFAAAPATRPPEQTRAPSVAEGA